MTVNKVTNILDTIDKSTYEVKKESDEIFNDIDSLREELPDTSPRFILLSYPYKSDDGRLVSPLVLVYWKPPSGQEMKMLFAGAVEMFRGKAGVSKLISIEDEDEFDDIEEQLK